MTILFGVFDFSIKKISLIIFFAKKIKNLKKKRKMIFEDSYDSSIVRQKKDNLRDTASKKTR